MMTDLLCPYCNKVFDFQNIMAYDNEQMVIEGIIYVIKCQNCRKSFVSENRYSKKQPVRQAKKLLDKIRRKLGKT